MQGFDNFRQFCGPTRGSKFDVGLLSYKQFFKNFLRTAMLSMWYDHQIILLQKGVKVLHMNIWRNIKKLSRYFVYMAQVSDVALGPVVYIWIWTTAMYHVRLPGTKYMYHNILISFCIFFLSIGQFTDLLIVWHLPNKLNINLLEYCRKLKA